MAANVWDAIHGLLAGDGALAALLATAADVGGPAVWYGRAPRHQALPYVSFRFPGGGGPHYHAPVQTGALYVEDLVMSVTCYAEDPTVCSAIGTRLNQLLDFGKPAISATDTLLACRRTSPADPIELEEETSEDGTDCWGSTYMYAIILQKTF